VHPSLYFMDRSPEAEVKRINMQTLRVFLTLCRLFSLSKTSDFLSKTMRMQCNTKLQTMTWRPKEGKKRRMDQ
jgi:hypothetical protein